MNTISEFSIHWKISSLDKDTKQLQSKLEELKVNEAIIKFNLEETKKSLERLDKLEKEGLHLVMPILDIGKPK